MALRAQGLPGYVLTLSGDTLRGTLTEARQRRQVHLLGTDGQLRKFDPAQIHGYGLRDHPPIKSAIVRQASGGTAHYFVIPRLLGPASLYAFDNEKGLLLQPAADTLYELSAYNWHLLLNRYLSGCPTLSMSDDEVLNTPFEEWRIIQLLTRYNRCQTPRWQPTPGIRNSVFRRGLGLEASLGNLQNDRFYSNQPSHGTSQQLVLALSFLRASGLQSDLGLGYTRLVYQTNFFH